MIVDNTIFWNLQTTYIVSSDQLFLFPQSIVIRQEKRRQELRVYLKNKTKQNKNKSDAYM